MLLDPADDYTVFDNAVAVTVSRADNSLSAYGVTATCSGLSTRELLAGGAVGLLPTDKAYRLQAETLAGFVPEAGDVVTDSGVAWTIIFVTSSEYGSTVVSYRAFCRQRL